MLFIDIPRAEYFDPKTEEFFYQDAVHLQLEHSLRSISKWEGIHHVPFLEQENMTPEQFLSYVQCMTVNKQTDPNVYARLREVDLMTIMEYMKNPMTAKTFNEKKPKKGKAKRHQTITAENFYHAMAYFGIPFDCENWHFNRLTALIKTCEENGGEDAPKMTYREQQRYWDGINEARKAKYHTKG